MPRFSFASSLLAALVMAGTASATQVILYKTVLTDGNFEIRDYPARQTVQMDIVGDLKLAAYDGFRVFADPTLPQGAADEQAQLTTPVVETPALSERFGTYPLFQLWNARVWTVSFEPPAGWAPGKLTRSRAPQIRRIDEPPVRMAVLRYDGRGGDWDAGLGWRRAAEALVTQVARRHLKTEGPLMLAQYNAPQTSQVFRHFAVMIALKDSANSAPAPATLSR